MKKYKQHIVFGGIILLVAIIDIVTKVLTQNVSNLSIINGLISFDAVTNSGAAWSILREHTWLLIIFSIIFIALIITFYIFNKNRATLEIVALGLIVGGALGNLYDRIFYGGVRDFIRTDFINFPVFNIADSCITIGAILFAIYVVFFLGKKGKNER